MSALFNKIEATFPLLRILLLNILNSVSINMLLLFPPGMIGIFRQSSVYPDSLALPITCKFIYYVNIEDWHFLHLRIKGRNIVCAVPISQRARWRVACTYYDLSNLVDIASKHFCEQTETLLWFCEDGINKAWRRKMIAI